MQKLNQIISDILLLNFNLVLFSESGMPKGSETMVHNFIYDKLKNEPPETFETIFMMHDNNSEVFDPCAFIGSLVAMELERLFPRMVCEVTIIFNGESFSFTHD